MTDSTTTAAPEGETPPVATSTNTTNTGSLNVPVSTTPIPETGATTSTTEEFDKDRAMALIAKLRDEAKTAKSQAKDAADMKARLDAIEAEKLSAEERTAKERDDAIAKATEAEGRLREQAIRLAVYGQRDTMGLASADLAIAALDHSAVQFDDQGQPTNVADLLTALIEREPILKGTPAKPVIPSTDGGAGGGSGPSLTADELEAARLTGATPEQYQAAKSRLGGSSVIDVMAAAASLAKKG